MSELQYISYLRVSRKEQSRSGLGLESQRAYIDHVAKIDNAIIVKEYLEVEGGGKMDNRPILHAAIKHALKIGAPVICAKIDRISRSVSDTLNILEQLNGQLISCEMPGGPVDKFMLTLHAAFAARELDLIRARTKAALQAKAARGHKLGSPANLKQEHRLNGAASSAKMKQDFKSDIRLVAVVESLVKQGLSQSEVATRLNELGFLTFRKKPWTNISVNRLINQKA